ncbi:hypothetical protein VTK26DRAFT_5791 [Humicola hyalothermophila]
MSSAKEHGQDCDHNPDDGNGPQRTDQDHDPQSRPAPAPASSSRNHPHGVAVSIPSERTHIYHPTFGTLTPPRSPRLPAAGSTAQGVYELPPLIPCSLPDYDALRSRRVCVRGSMMECSAAWVPPVDTRRPQQQNKWRYPLNVPGRTVTGQLSAYRPMQSQADGAQIGQAVSARAQFGQQAGSANGVSFVLRCRNVSRYHSHPPRSVSSVQVLVVHLANPTQPSSASAASLGNTRVFPAEG